VKFPVHQFIFNTGEISMTREYSKMKNSTLFIIIMLLLVIPSYTQGNKDQNQFRWAINLEGVTYGLNGDNGWGYGAGLKISFHLSGKLGIQVGGYGLPTSSGGYTFRGLALDGGIRYRLSTIKPELAIEGGISHIFGDDSDGSEVNAVGIYTGASVIWWFFKHIGFSGRGIVRYWFEDEYFKHGQLYGLSPSFSAGIAVRF
jgi:hypothetical protein